MEHAYAMGADFAFTFAKIRQCFEEALACGYCVITCREYLDMKKSGWSGKLLVNRVDIDQSPRKAKRLAVIFNDLKIKASFFVRLHAEEYNPFSFENYRCLRFIRDTGHEVGYHSEVMDQFIIWEEGAESCLRRDIAVLNSILNLSICGVASHRGMTGLNNLDFWRGRKPSDFGLLYEAYDRQPEFGLFHDSFYVSDSDWTHWKCYDRGVLRQGDHKSLGEHCHDGHMLIYNLIHPETFYDEHFYE